MFINLQSPFLSNRFFKRYEEEISIIIIKIIIILFSHIYNNNLLGPTGLCGTSVACANPNHARTASCEDSTVQVKDSASTTNRIVLFFLFFDLFSLVYFFFVS